MSTAEKDERFRLVSALYPDGTLTLNGEKQDEPEIAASLRCTLDKINEEAVPQGYPVADYIKIEVGQWAGKPPTPLTELPCAPLDQLLVLARPRYVAAALVSTALRHLGDYPADAPDYDPEAVRLLQAALQRLATGLWNEELGKPHPPTSAAKEDPEDPAEDPQRKPVPWLAEALAGVE